MPPLCSRLSAILDTPRGGDHSGAVLNSRWECTWLVPSFDDRSFVFLCVPPLRCFWEGYVRYWHPQYSALSTCAALDQQDSFIQPPRKLLRQEVSWGIEYSTPRSIPHISAKCYFARWAHAQMSDVTMSQCHSVSSCFDEMKEPLESYTKRPQLICLSHPCYIFNEMVLGGK
jgi:hypothetical protein